MIGTSFISNNCYKCLIPISYSIDAGVNMNYTPRVLKPYKLYTFSKMHVPLTLTIY